MSKKVSSQIRRITRINHPWRRHWPFYMGGTLVLAVTIPVAFATWSFFLRDVGVPEIHSVPAAAIHSFGIHYYVAPNGNDSNNGSAGSPWRTLAHAASVVVPWTVVHVAPGTYPESLTITASGTATAPICFISDQKWAAKVIGDGSTNWAVRADGDYVDVVGFDVTNKSVDGHEGIETSGDHIQIAENHVHDIPAGLCAGGLGGAGIMVGNIHAVDVDSVANVVHDIGDYTHPCKLIHGIYYENQAGHIYNNIVFHNTGWGIHLWHNASHITIANNTAAENGSGGIIVGAGDDPDGAIDDYTVVINNIAAYNGGYGIREDGRTGEHNVYSHNLVYANTHDGFYLGGGKKDVDTVSKDPQFVALAREGRPDYRVASSSPAIHSGMWPVGVPVDIEGTATTGSRWDIGAHQSRSTSPMWVSN